MKYIIDENCQIPKNKLPRNIFNVKDVFPDGRYVSDKELLEFSIKNDFVIITRDHGLIFMANKKNRDIVYAYGVRGKIWIFIPKEIEVRHRIKLIGISERMIMTHGDEKVFVPLISEHNDRSYEEN